MTFRARSQGRKARRQAKQLQKLQELAEPLVQQARNEGMRKGAQLMRDDIMQLHPDVKQYDEPRSHVVRSTIDQFPRLSQSPSYELYFPQHTGPTNFSSFMKFEANPMSQRRFKVRFRPEYYALSCTDEYQVRHELRWVNWVLDGPSASQADVQVSRTLVRSESVLKRAIGELCWCSNVSRSVLDLLHETYDEIRRLNGHFEANEEYRSTSRLV